MEEKLNAVTHGVGAGLAVLALVALLVSVHAAGDIWCVTSAVMYGVSLVVLYLASTLYHSFSGRRVKQVFQIIDHSAIYVLIAGTYTPFLLILLRGTLGWIMFGVIWGLAVVGILFKTVFTQRFEILSTVGYLLMGWLIVFLGKPLVMALPTPGLIWLVAGGLLYSLGSVFYLARRLPFHHAIWHLFVIAGSAAHFVTVYFYVLPD
ncbi:MAG TPA: hemolysin III family protein [Negativicutes bacterium]|nr:hemolysin III family protein [Negativicutes bacterium]